MREINRNNYEEFFLDYSEGNLNSLQCTALDKFLRENPDLKVELEGLDCPVLKHDNCEMNLEFLKEIPFRESFDDFCVARLEGDLSASTQMAFDAFLNKNKESKKENRLFEQTILQPDKEIVYPHKERLQKKKRKAALWWYFSGVAVAASILFLFSIGNFFYKFDGKSVKKEQVVFATSTIKPEALNFKAIHSIESNRSDKLELVDKRMAKIPEKEELAQRALTWEVKGDQKMRIEQIRVQPIELVVESQPVLLANADISEKELQLTIDESSVMRAQNSGLEQLGMSWKSSVPKKKLQNSLLFAIAKLGVDKLEEIAGKNLQLEKKYDSTSEKTRFDFNTPGIGFSKTVK
ncbi:hypothetical protein [Labilibaculum sp.]|uniref:hypothetical protein n=1 Tax=Labilibaculum sp. TaxID=2060723 RepID=UPI003566E920